MIDKIENLLNQMFPEGIQTFFTPSVVNDPYNVIFSENNVEIRYSAYYEYIEVLGLSDEELTMFNEKLSDRFHI